MRLPRPSGIGKPARDRSDSFSFSTASNARGQSRERIWDSSPDSPGQQAKTLGTVPYL